MATIIDNPQSQRVQAIFLKGHLQLMSKGMTSRGLSKTKALQLAGQITGKKYGRGQHGIAAEDIKTWLKDN